MKKAKILGQSAQNNALIHSLVEEERFLKDLRMKLVNRAFKTLK